MNRTSYVCTNIKSQTYPNPVVPVTEDTPLLFCLVRTCTRQQNSRRSSLIGLQRCPAAIGKIWFTVRPDEYSNDLVSEWQYDR